MQRRSDYAYNLPAARIAQAPADRREDSRLLYMNAGADGALEDRVFADLPDLLPANAVLVLNDTRVLRARLFGERPTGGKVELLLCSPAIPTDPSARTWSCLTKASKPLRPGDTFSVAGTPARVAGPRSADGTLDIEFETSAYEVMERAGALPLPPYIARPHGPGDADDARYQTVYAQTPGAVAAPTAGLHMSEALLERLRARADLDIATLTLHVGPGTFLPVREDDLERHTMHAERYLIPERTARLCSAGRPVVALGTTVVRALESAARDGGLDAAQDFRPTDIFIRPGFHFEVVTHLITNFHLPESTLLMLVCAFGGYQPVMDAYKTAIALRYRFYSYGDAMMLSRAT